jgi:hypothetical protein
LTRQPFAVPIWLSKDELEARCLRELRSLDGFHDLTAVDIEAEAGDPSGCWFVTRTWRHHVVELPGGSGWHHADAVIARLKLLHRLGTRQA